MSDVSNPVEVNEPVVHTEAPLEQHLPETVPMEIERMLGVDAGIPLDVKNRLSTIYEIAKEGAKDLGDVLSNVSALQRKIGASKIGQEAINRIYNYAVLLKRQNDLDKQIKAYEVE